MTAETQEQVDRRIPLLLDIPAAVRFVSIEPMLGEIDFNRSNIWNPWDHGCYLEGIGWVICGGESGHHARTIHPDWVRKLRDQCNAAGVTFFFKQWGDNPDRSAFEMPMICAQNDKPKCGNLLDGKLYEEFPKIS